MRGTTSSWLPQAQHGVYPIVSMGVSNPGYVVYTIYGLTIDCIDYVTGIGNGIWPVLEGSLSGIEAEPLLWLSSKLSDL